MHEYIVLQLHLMQSLKPYFVCLFNESEKLKF